MDSLRDLRFWYILVTCLSHYLYADDTCIFVQEKDTQKIEDLRNKEFSTLCAWFVDNRLWIHNGKDKTKWVLFSKTKRWPKLNVSCGNRSITQYHTIECLWCQINCNLSGEYITIKVSKKFNEKVKSVYRQKHLKRHQKPVVFKSRVLIVIYYSHLFL